MPAIEKRPVQGKQEDSVKQPSIVALALLLVFVLACAPAAPAPQPAGQTGTEVGKGTGAAAWEAEWQKTLAAAKQEGKIITLTHPGLDYKNLMAAFQKAYPDIKVEHTGDRPSDFSPKIITEQKNGVFNWDVIVATTSNMNNVLLPADVYQPITPFLLLPESIDDKYWGAGKFELYTSEKGPYILIHNAMDDSRIYVNRDKVSKEKFKGLDDLLKPEFRGQIVIDDCTVPAHGASALIGMWASKGEQFVRRLLSEQKPVFQDTVAITTQWVATGRFGIAVGVDQPELAKLQKEGIGKSVDEIKWDGGNLSTQGSAVFKNAPHPNAAKVFLNWFWSKEGQTAWLEGRKEAVPASPWNSRRNDVPVMDPNIYPKYENWKSYTSWSMDSGAHLVKSVTDLCKQLRP